MVDSTHPVWFDARPWKLASWGGYIALLHPGTLPDKLAQSCIQPDPGGGGRRSVHCPATSGTL